MPTGCRGLSAARAPCGSGSVESAPGDQSALEGAGDVLDPREAECFLLLRAQLVSGRWEVMLANSPRKRLP